MAFRLEWLPETAEELRRFFSKKEQRAIIKKVEHFAENLPQSIRLRSVQPIRGQEDVVTEGTAYELDAGSGHRVALVVYEARMVVRVYLVGTHEYAKNQYLRAAQERLGDP